jgi:hypothetical protein
MDDENGLSPIGRMVVLARSLGLEGETESPRLKMVSLRIPLALLASVDAFASITAQSRNNTLISLLEAGVYAVGNELDDPEQYFAAREHFLDQHTGE